MNDIIRKCINALKGGKKLMFCGNGGSAELANHIVAEFVVKFGAKRQALDAISLSANMAVITACANDFGFKYVFSRQVEAHGKEGDILFCISTSGESKNVLLALEAAKKMGVLTVAMAGDFECSLNKNADFILSAKGETATPRIQEAQLKMAHELVELVENGLEEHKQTLNKPQTRKTRELDFFSTERVQKNKNARNIKNLRDYTLKTREFEVSYDI